MDSRARRSSNPFSGNVVQRKKARVSLNDMSTEFDHVLSTGSRLRRVCPTCYIPLMLSARKCNSCKSKVMIIWCKKFETTGWTNPRKPPIYIPYPRHYSQCKDFLKGKECINNPCGFAHGQDELEIWELYRSRVRKQQEVAHGKQRNHSRDGGLKERQSVVLSLQKSRSCMSLNKGENGTKFLPRTESLSSLRSLHSFSNPFDMLNSEDMQDEVGSESECSNLSQNAFDVDEPNLGSAGPSTSSLSLDMDTNVSPGEDAYQIHETTIPRTPVQSGDDAWTDVVKRQKILPEKRPRGKRGGRRRNRNKSSLGSTGNIQEKEYNNARFSSIPQPGRHYSNNHEVEAPRNRQQLNEKFTNFRPPPDGTMMGRYKLCPRFEKGRCNRDKCTFAHGTEERAHWLKLYQRQSQRLAQLREEPLLTERFSEKIRRRIKCEGEHHVLKEDIPGVTVDCSSPLEVKLDGPDSPQNHMWIFDVRFETKYQLSLNQVVFLSDAHLDKFTFLRSPTEDPSSKKGGILLFEEDFVEVTGKQESAVQFCVQFSTGELDEFEQKLAFDFGRGSVLVRSLSVSVVSTDTCNNKEDLSLHTSYCCIPEWSKERLELVLCGDLMRMNVDGLCDQYSIPDVLPDPSECTEFTRDTYCKLWHDILFTEEEHVHREITRYDIQNGKMKIINSFQSPADETVFTQPGEFFGEVYLFDYLVMDEVAGHIINRSVMSVILRLKLDQTQSNRVYECSVKMKTLELVVIKLNAILCEEYLFEKDQEICIDLKFRYNRLPMCEMHQAIDMCQQKSEILLPNVKNVSYKHKKSIPDWFMDRKPNTNQHEAIAMILDSSLTPPILVIGPFGTGKTFTLNLACVSILCESERNKVLICTHSNSAADIHLQHLDEKIRNKPSLRIRPLRVLYRLVNTKRIAEKLRKYCLIEETTNAVREPTWDEIRDHNVIITTLVTARMLWKFYQDGRLRFTHILIDEAAQALEPKCMIPLVMADENTKIVLAGDHKQMAPLAYSEWLWPKDFGPKRSLLERLFTHYGQHKSTSSQPCSSSETSSTFLQIPYVVLLTENYRCHAKILEFSSDSFYGGELVARGDQTTHDFIPVLSFYTASGVDQQVERSLAYYNEAEVAEVVKQVEVLIHHWPDGWGKKNIGVLTPYYDQVRRIREALRRKNLHFVDVETVENAQGKEFKALFISTVRTGWTCLGIERRNTEFNCDLAELDFGFLSNPRFLNSALTRAQSLFAVVGDPMSLCSIGACSYLWKDYLKRCDANKGLYGCTLKAVTDFCLGSQPINTPFKDREIIAMHDASVSNEDVGSGNSDGIIREFIKACRETRKNDEAQTQNEPDENYPSLDDVSAATSVPRLRGAIFSRKFSPSLKNPKPQLGFNVEASEELFRLMGGESLQENRKIQSYHDTDMFSQEGLLKMIKENPFSFIKCTFRVDTSGKQSRHYGQLPAPDSPDIQIPGRVEGVYEDDIVVLELLPNFIVRGEQGQVEDIITVGCIRGVLRRLIDPEERRFVCQVDRADNRVMIPINKSSPKLKTENTEIVDELQWKAYQEALVGERVFVVKYKKWLPDFPYPLGKVIGHMPHGKDFRKGMHVLYEEYNIRREFTKKLRTSVAEEFGEDWQIPDSESHRPAYRDNVFTIDPPESSDLDDAISMRSLGNGNYNVHVHIADVSYFVQPDTQLDKEARLRGTSYYPPKPEKNVPMLPRELSERCCSLVQGKDRLAVTVSFEVTPEGNVVGDGSIERSVVCSSAKFTYLDAQQIIDEMRQLEIPNTVGEKQIPIREAISIAHRIAQGHQRSRLGVQRSLNHQKRDDCDDDDHGNEREAHQMIEEIMIMANHLVAKYLLKKFPKCTPLRVQSPPKSRRLVEWRQKFQKFLHVSIGLHWLGDGEMTNKETMELKVPCKTWRMIIGHVNRDCGYEQLVRLVCDVDLFPQLSVANSRQQQLQQRGRYISSGEKFQDTSFLMHNNEAAAQVLDTDVSPDLPSDMRNVPEDPTDDETNSDTPASSSVNESRNNRNQQDMKNMIFYGHWNLRLNAYCHFTSPIRRYIDIIVHRLVLAAQYGTNFVDPDDLTEICDRCTFLDRNSSRFNKETKKLQLAVSLQGTNRFASAYIEEVTRDALTVFFGTEEFELLPSTPVPIGRLGPEQDPDEVVYSVTLQWIFRFLRLDKHKHAQPKVEISDDEIIKLENQKEDKDEANSSDNDFDYTVSSDLWNKVLEAIKDENEDELKFCLQDVDEYIQKRGKPKSSIQVRQKLQNDPNVSLSTPCGHPDADKLDPKEAEHDEFLEVIRSFEPYDRVRVQMYCQMNEGVLSPSIQLFEVANKIFACVEHRSFPTTCFAKIPRRRPSETFTGDIREYVRVWKPVLMMEIVTSAVHDGDFVTLSNLRVSFARDSEGVVTMEFKLSKNYAKNHFLTPLDLNLMCVRVKDPNGSGKDSGYWIGHFQISEELRKKIDAIKAMEALENPESTNIEELESEISDSKNYQAIVARFINSSTPVPESFIQQRFCYVTAEMILLSSPNRRCFDALIDSIKASELIKNICTEQDYTKTAVNVGRPLPRELSLSGFDPLNHYQRDAVRKALSRPFTPIQGPPGTGKTVTGVHIAYWFAHMNKQRNPVLGEDGTMSKGAMVFYCGPSNKSVDVVARFLKRIPGLKILRIYGQEIERKTFPVPDKITQFRSKHVSAQLKADEELRDVSLHHVIRSAECVKFAEILRKYDDEFKRWKRNDCRTCSKELKKKIQEFKKIKSQAEKWAITQNGVDVILTTCTTAYGHRLLDVCENIVSQCIIDECGMCIEAETLCAMLASKPEKVVLIGDHKQLRPVIRCKEARDLGLGISMFERFSGQAHMLKIQYRMHENLCEFPSMQFYEGKLETADKVRNREPDNVTWRNGDSYPFAFHHVEGVEETLIVNTDQGNQNSKKNQKEIEKVIYLAQRLRGEGIKVEDIIILSPYRAQCFEITEKLKKVGLSGISVTSVVAAQGSEKNYVILSLVRSLPQREIEIRPSRSWLTENLGFLTDEHQVNVALTRAKRGLCIVGNANLLGVCKVWGALLSHYKLKRCFVEA